MSSLFSSLAAGVQRRGGWEGAAAAADAVQLRSLQGPSTRSTTQAGSCACRQESTPSLHVKGAWPHTLLQA